MVAIHVYRRKRKDKAGREVTAKEFTAQIRFPGGGPAYLRATGKSERRAAEIEAGRIARQIQDIELPKRGKEIMTVDLMLSRWYEEHGKRLRSVKDVEWQIERLLKGLGLETPVEDLGSKDIHRFVQERKAAGDGPATINRCLQTIRSIMRYAAKRWETPMRLIDFGVHMQKEPRERTVYISPDEVRALIQLLPEHIALLVAWTVYTGCRLRESETLKWERIDLERRAAEVETKGGGFRTVWLSDKAIRVLERLLRVYKDRGENWMLVFDCTNRRRHWHAARSAIKRTDVRFHDLRAMTGTYARQFANADVKLISTTLGHTDTKVTERYTRVVNTEIPAMLNLLPDVMSKPREIE